MIDFVSPDSPSKKLGFWFSVLGILLGVMVADHSGDPESLQSAWETHWISASHIPQTVSAPPPLIAAAIKRAELNEPVREDVVVVQIETLSFLPLPPPGRKLQDKGILRKKSVSVRGKKAERLYRSIILRVSHRHQVDPAMVKAIIMAESSFNPKAISNRGAVGLMQLMPNTAKSLGVVDAFDPEHNINGGVQYFKKLLKEFRGDVVLALAAYNAGSRKVKEHQGVPPFKTTQAYIKKVFEYYHYYKNQSIHPDDRA
jgi:hypothetical protein